MKSSLTDTPAYWSRVGGVHVLQLKKKIVNEMEVSEPAITKRNEPQAFIHPECGNYVRVHFIQRWAKSSGICSIRDPPIIDSLRL